MPSFGTVVDNILASGGGTKATVKVATIIKEWWDADLREETIVSSRVHQWGTITGDSTLVRKDWEVPNLTMIFKNIDGFFSEWKSDSIWNTGLVRRPEESILKFEYRLLWNEGTKKTTLLTYIGAIQNVYVRTDGSLYIAEIITSLHHDNELRQSIDKNSGDTAKEVWTWV